MQRKSRRLAVESLESRSLLAGNIAVSVTNGSLFITGDNEGNSLTVGQAGQNAFRIQTTGETLINGSTDSDQTFTGVTNDINIALKGGEDGVSIGSQFSDPVRIPRNLNVDCGDAIFDSIAVNAACGTSGRGGYAILRSAAVSVFRATVPKNFVATGIDQFYAGGTLNVSGDLVVSGTSRDDYYVLDAIKANNLRVDTLAGRDQVRLTARSTVRGDVNIDTGEGNDRVVIGSLTANNLRVNLAGGDDWVETWGQSLIHQEARIFGGEGAEHVLLEGFEAQDAIYVWLYSENDRLEIKSTASLRAVLGGGPGADTLILGAGNEIGSIEQTGFE